MGTEEPLDGTGSSRAEQTGEGRSDSRDSRNNRVELHGSPVLKPHHPGYTSHARSLAPWPRRPFYMLSLQALYMTRAAVVLWPRTGERDSLNAFKVWAAARFGMRPPAVTLRCFCLGCAGDFPREDRDLRTSGKVQTSP
ncbi:hypothetical protein N7462_009207 [Penicillium macrosclerotiorum]|uniref:uncharacterized protein n=1 Tax=Penicillium macrosclerotiorum TaxID=303699 RepID=UPI0025496B50|nr:uncharacterized protein N7462_009207 [Penicillium macrosclerotiorum]KAJ5673768.1 hypothetical protein N7462_009207 [Penicillium macrosclerotiorum]